MTEPIYTPAEIAERHIAHARQQQLLCAEVIIAGGACESQGSWSDPHSARVATRAEESRLRGATLGLFDWMTEEILMEEEEQCG